MDRRKTGGSDSTQETDRQFLEKAGVNVLVKDVMIKLIENRPEDPVAFLADHYESLGDKVDRVTKAHQQVILTHHSKPAFHNNVLVAYEILGQSRLTEKKTRQRREMVTRTVKGFNGAVYSELLNMLCKKFPSGVKDKLMKRIRCRDYEMVVFDIFKSGVFTCLVLKDFLCLAEGLYKMLDTGGKGKADRVVCEALTQHFQQTVTSTGTNPQSVLESGYLLGPEKVYSAIGSMMFKNTNVSPRGTMSAEDFVAAMADSFLLKVNIVK